MTSTFTDLHERAATRETFTHLYDIITSRQNILLAFRTIKSNEGSQTPGTDGKTITDMKKLTDDELVALVQHTLKLYRPKKVRRTFIEKDNGKWRPLGIPCMVDRLIQQCCKQVLEPIAEAHFYMHSYGFRPLRSTHHAMARAQYLVNIVRMHYVVDIDIKGFFDNVNHTLLIKQCWNMGIRDKKVLRIISKMLKAEIEGEGIPSRGTPQGGILSPLLSGIVLHDLDMWVARQWEIFEAHHAYKWNSHKYAALRLSGLKEGYIVRYADDFKIFCPDAKSAQKWFHAVRLYLKDRLKLDISPEKSQIVNLRKRPSEFLGFTIRAAKKGNNRVAHTGVTDKKKQQIKKETRARIQQLRLSPTSRNAILFNSFVLGLHNYFRRATHVSTAFSRLAYDLRAYTYNRLKSVATYAHPANPPPTYTKFYRTSYRTFQVAGVYLYPLANVKMTVNKSFNQQLNPFTAAGRRLIHQKLKGHIVTEIIALMNANIIGRSVEYLDNRISRYSMRSGKCEIIGMFLVAMDVHCHHVLPSHLGGSDKYSNLRILHKDVHKLIHATQNQTIEQLMTKLGLTAKMVDTVNKYRSHCKLEPIQFPVHE
ncbi:group II intron reverse transcriptase/maturase [Cohnella fermenti]|uniref:Group II intron reverse transcriptase/maturase n=2 Tax=Cohnella fermenti TaxID=2565925 RepID=A0A4S4BKX7_9BACL|nr:group II intron reverse transcriptase/maturase [Cohnella fermenti]